MEAPEVLPGLEETRRIVASSIVLLLVVVAIVGGQPGAAISGFLMAVAWPYFVIAWRLPAAGGDKKATRIPRSRVNAYSRGALIPG